MTNFCYDQDCWMMVENAKQYFPEVIFGLLVVLGIIFFIGWRKKILP